MAQENSSPAYLAELLSKVGLGDRAAFSSLYQTTSAKLFGLALRILLRRDLAEEALQDAFVKIWHNAESFNPEKAAAMTWMTAVVRNRCLDVLRAAPHEAQLAEEQSFDDWASEDLGPLAEITASTEVKALMNCMSHLAPLQRQAIAMSYFHDLAHEQLAQQLVQPLGTIKTWIRRGLQVLKNCLTTA